MQNTAMSVLDAHDHTIGKGQKVPTAGININADLSFANNDAVDLRSVQLFNQSVPLVLSSDRTCLSAVNGDLYYNNASGVSVQLTSGAAGIPNAGNGFQGNYQSSGAAAVYNSGTKTYTFLDQLAAQATLAFAGTSGPINVNGAIVATSGYKVVLDCFYSALSGSALATAFMGSAANPANTYRFVAPFSGCIRALTAVEYNATTITPATTLIFKLNINGVQQFIATMTQGQYKVTTTVAHNAVPAYSFSAGDEISVSYLTGSGWTQTTKYYASVIVEQ